LVVGKYRVHRAKGPISAGFVVEAEHIQDALLVLLQHGLVSVEFVQTACLYRFNVHRARLLARYPRFVEYAKKALDETAAALVEELVIHGRMTTVDAIVAAVNHLHELGDDAIKSDRYTTRQAVVESFRRLVEGGFIEIVPPLKLDADEEVEFEGETTDKTVTLDEETTKAIKVEDQMEDVDGDDPAVVSLLSQGPYRYVLPRNTVWRVNVDMFHHSLRAFSLGRLVAERFGHKVQSAGSMVTAALKLAAHKQYALKNQNYEEQTVFSPLEILNYLPKPVQQALEKKPGGSLVSLSRALVELSNLTYPAVLSEVEQARGNPNGGKFEMSTRQLVNYLRGQIYHQVRLWIR
jgi:DNA-directed RNA polymerase III subunit RPC3